MRTRIALWARGRMIPRLAMVVALAGAAGPVATARAENVVNTTIHVPASVQTNPCFPADVVNLSGDIHIVMTSTADGMGGYHEVNQLNSQLSGRSITSDTRYINSENQTDDWYARPPFPAVHTHTYDFNLISQSNTPNYVLHMTMHETVTANGIPTAVVDDYRMDCQG
jgi:hypothetical protein